MTLIQRAALTYQTVGRTVVAWISPLSAAVLSDLMRSGAAAVMALDPTVFTKPDHHPTYQWRGFRWRVKGFCERLRLMTYRRLRGEGT